MVDTFSLMVSHGLIALLFWRLISRTDLDTEIDMDWRGSLGHLRPDLSDIDNVTPSQTASGQTGTGHTDA
jgi:hypothetical protein